MKNNKYSETKSRTRGDPLTKSYFDEQFMESDVDLNPANKKDSDFLKLVKMNSTKKEFLKEKEEKSDNNDKTNSSNENSKSVEESFEKIFKELSHYDVFSLARHGQHEILECLLIKGISPDSRDLDGNTILIIGAQNGNKRTIKIALRYGAQINMKNCNGNTALHYANEYNYIDVANYLIKKGANPNIENIKGFKAKDGITKNNIKLLESRSSNADLYNRTKSKFKTNTNKIFKFNAKKINFNINSNEKYKSEKNKFNDSIMKSGISIDNKPKIV